MTEKQIKNQIKKYRSKPDLITLLTWSELLLTNVIFVT